jgi:hypothetical protein
MPIGNLRFQPLGALGDSAPLLLLGGQSFVLKELKGSGSIYFRATQTRTPSP